MRANTMNSADPMAEHAEQDEPSGSSASPQDSSVLRRVIPSPYFRYKGVVSRMVALVLLVPGLALMLLLILLIRLTSRGPALYRQVRVGRHGRPFTMYKLRTMRHQAEALTGPVWTQCNDPRVTRIGWLLRILHMDELPQLINVLLGHMDLFGPRPERPEFIPTLAQRIPGYLQRLEVRPGVSGLAQINLPPDTNLDSVRHKLALDLEYIESATLFLDVRMFLCTGLRMFGLRHGRAVQLMRLERLVTGTASPPCTVGRAKSNGNGRTAESEVIERGSLRTTAEPKRAASYDAGSRVPASALRPSSLDG